MKTTLNQILLHTPCKPSWDELLKYLGKTTADDEPLSLLTIFESNGFKDTVWAFRATEGFDREIRLYAVWCASEVKHLMAPDSVKLLEVATKFANGKASFEELQKARSAALSAAQSAAGSAARFAAWYAAFYAAWAAAWYATWYADEAEEEAEQLQAQELKRVLLAIEAGQDPYPETN